MNLVEGIQAECNRIRDVAIPAYSDPFLKGAGAMAIALMRADIAMGEQAIASGDVVLMVKVLERLKSTGQL
jgi:hypothetical protein